MVKSNLTSACPCEYELTLSLHEGSGTGFSDFRLAFLDDPEGPAVLVAVGVYLSVTVVRPPELPKGGGNMGLLKIQFRIENRLLDGAPVAFFDFFNLDDFFELDRERPPADDSLSGLAAKPDSASYSEFKAVFAGVPGSSFFFLDFIFVSLKNYTKLFLVSSVKK